MGPRGPLIRLRVAPLLSVRAGAGPVTADQCFEKLVGLPGHRPLERLAGELLTLLAPRCGKKKNTSRLNKKKVLFCIFI